MVGVEGLDDGSILDVVMLLGFSVLDSESLLQISGNPLQREGTSQNISKRRDTCIRWGLTASRTISLSSLKGKRKEET